MNMRFLSLHRPGKAEPEVIIPESLLVHDDLAPSTANKEENVAPPGERKDENINKQEMNVTSRRTEKADNKEQNQKQEVETDPPQLTKDGEKDETESKDAKDTEENREKTNGSVEKKSNKLQKPSPENSKESTEKVNTTDSLRSGKEITKHSKQISAKSSGKSGKKSESLSKQDISDTNAEGSPCRPRRTVQLPARLAESEMMMTDRKRTLSVVENNPTKRAKLEQEEKTAEPEKWGETAGEIQESENALNSRNPNLRRNRKLKRGRPRLSAENKPKAGAEKTRTEKTLACPVCKKLMKEYENVFDHVKKQHENHKDFETLMADLKVRDILPFL